MTFSAPASISPPGLKALPNPAASASPRTPSGRCAARWRPSLLISASHVGVVTWRIGAVIPIAGVGSGPVVATVWVIVVRPAPSAVPPLWVIVIGPAPSTAPPAAEGGDDNKSTAKAVVIKSVEFAESVESVKPDLNTSFCQALDITPLLAKFGRPWHYASGGRGALRRVWAAGLPAVARSA